MIQKKVCMIGVYGTGKTSLVQQYVHSRFSEKYHSTVGVKIDRKVLEVIGEPITLVLWDIAGKEGDEEVPASYVRGAHGVIFVADFTRRETWDELPAFDQLVQGAAGSVPIVVALNKADLTAQRVIRPEDEKKFANQWDIVHTSAKTGQGVEDIFQRLARAMVKVPGATA
jgi:small GTP-binding protein